MLSIKKLSSSSEAGKYYDKADYYTKGESGVDISSAWFGKGAEALGLFGSVEKEQFISVLDGKLPNGQTLARLSDNRVPGWDFTFSAPKSLSLLALIGGDERLMQAHFDAVKTTLSFAEKEFLVTRLNTDGQVNTVSTESLVSALFSHTTSRALDPQLHTHSVLVNMTEGPDQQWRSIESKPLFTNKMLLGQVYRAELALLVQQLGYEITWDRQKGTFELKGVDQEVIDYFSQRRQQITSYAEENGLEGGKAMAEAALKTRSSKKNVSSEDILNSWDEAAQTLHFDPSSLIQQARTVAKETTKSVTLFHVENVVRFAFRNLSFNEAVFTRQSLLQEAILFSHGEISIQQLTHAIDSLVHKKELVAATLDDIGKRQIAYTTPQAIEIEQHNLQLVALGVNEVGSIARTEDIEHGIARYNAANPTKPLQQEQAETVSMALLAKDRVIGIQGYAGVGKSTSLRAFREIAEMRGYNVRGLAPTGKAAQELERSAGISSDTLDSLLERMNKSDSLDDLSGDIWVVDESSMSNSRHFNQLMNLSRKTNARLLVVGDRAQLSAVEQGKPFEQMQDDGMAVKVMSNIQRQKNSKIKSAVVNAIHGEIQGAFKAISSSSSKDTNVVQIKNAKKRADKVVDHYVDLVSEAISQGKSYDEAINHYVKLIIPDNAGRHAANAQIRKQLQAKQILQKDTLATKTYINTGLKPEEKADALSYKSGHVVRFLSENKSLGVPENAYFTVERVDDDKQHVHLINDHGLRIKWNPHKQGGREQYGVSVYDTLDVRLAPGDFIRWRDRNDEAGLKNADIGSVLKIDKTKVTLKMKNGELKTIDVNDERYKHFEYEYASTVYAAQGDTYQKVVTQFDSSRKNLVNQKSFYVTLSRAVQDITLYTDDIGKTIKTIEERSGNKTSALESRGYIYQQSSHVSAPGIPSVPYLNSVIDAARDAIAELSIQEAVFSRNELIKLTGRNSRGSYSVSEINEAIDHLTKEKELQPATMSGKKASIGAFTTNKAIVEEWRNVEHVKRGINQAGRIANSSSLSEILQSERFINVPTEFKNSVDFALSSTDRFVGITTPNRDGQLALLEHLGAAIEQRGFNVKALNISSKQVEYIHQETGLQSQTLASFLYGLENRRVDVRNNVWLIDQAQVLSSSDFGRILTAANEQGARVIFTGDAKERGAITQGKPFQQMIQSGMKHFSADRDFTNFSSASLSRLFENSTEIRDKDERLHAAVAHYVSLSDEQRDNHIFWIPNAESRDVANDRIRRLMVKDGRLAQTEHGITTLQKVGLNIKEAANPMNYSVGMSVKAHCDNEHLGIEKGQYYRVTKRTLNAVVLEVANKQIEVNHEQLGMLVHAGLSVYRDRKLNIAVGERIRWKERYAPLGINAGDTLTVASINKGNIEVRNNKGEILTLDQGKLEHSHFTYAYTANHFDVSSGSYQSASVIFESHRRYLLSQKTVGSLLSAVKKDITSFTDNTEKVRQAIDERVNDKQSALAGIGVMDDLSTVTKPAPVSQAFNEFTVAEAINTAVSHLYNNNAVFKRTDVLKTAIQFSGHSHESLNAELDRQISTGDLVQNQLVHDGKKYETVITTKAAYRRESYMLEVMQHGIKERSAMAKSVQLEQAANKFGFNEDQERVATHLFFNKDSVIGIENNTSQQVLDIYKALNDVATQNRLILKAFTPRTELSEHFQNETGVETKNIQSLLTSLSNMKRKPNLKHDVWLVNNSEMLSTQEMADLLTLGRQTQARIILSGDTKQNASIGQGMPLRQLLDNGLKSETIYVNDMAKANTTRLAWQDAFAGKAAKALEKLDNDIKEIPQEDLRLQQVVDDYLNVPPSKRHDYMVVVASNQARDKATLLLRKGLKREGLIAEHGSEVRILENANLTKEQRGVSQFYEPGMQVRFNKDFQSLGVKKGDYCQVISSDNDVVHLRTVAGTVMQWRPSKVAGATDRGVSVYRERPLEVVKGDAIRWKETNKDLDRKSGDVGIVRDISSKGIEVSFKNGKSQLFSLHHLADRHFSHAYVETYLSAQGVKGVKYILGVIESYQKRLLNQKSFFTVLNKATERFYGYVDDRKKVQMQLERITGDKLNALQITDRNKTKQQTSFISKTSDSNRNTNRTTFMQRLGEKLFGSKTKNITGPDL